MSNQPIPTYEPAAIEPKWQLLWEQAQLFQSTPQNRTATVTQDRSKKRLNLFAFAYPSGSGLHVGHVESKTALDILSRFNRMQGDEVYFPVGWDAFGLPAENYAIKTGIPPAKTTYDAIHTFRRQIKRLGISYDWANEIATNHPEYYRWTQWLFLQLYKKGLAYKGIGMVNWCPSCQTVLANEQVVDGKCERCGTEVSQKELTQWYFKITQYQDELISGLETVDWPKATKQQQLNWIGKSQGMRIRFQLAIDGQPIEDTLEVFTTAHDTIYGCTFMVIAPEHSLLKKYQKDIKNFESVNKYLEQAAKKSELDRQIQKEKTGVVVQGIELINPVNGQRVPLYVADYVLATYGAGAIMAVPGHDERDAEFAKRYSLPVVFVTQEDSFIGYGEIKDQREKFILKNSGEFDGLHFAAGRVAILEKLEKIQAGEEKCEYKLRDWLISRQRYWGAPIPIVYDPEGNAHPVKEEHLPWRLPEDVDFKPTGESPLKSSAEFIARTEKLYGKGWRPEFDTMDTFVDSSWYYLRYCDARNTEKFADSAKLEAWLPVDLYLIGPEHIVLHLLYSRFFTKFLRDEGYFKFSEPFQKMRHQGMILGPDGKKMSKSKGNVINPDEIIQAYGADTLRVYEMFMGPLESDKPWDIRAVAGVSRFLRRYFNLVSQENSAPTDRQVSPALIKKLHQTIKKITQDIPALKFNTAIASLMELVNLWENQIKQQQWLGTAHSQLAILILAPFAPFMAEELWHQSGSVDADQFVHLQSWPVFDETLAADTEIVLGVQVNGKLRGELSVATGGLDDETSLIERAKNLPTVQPWIKDLQIKRAIYIPGKIVSLVTG